MPPPANTGRVDHVHRGRRPLRRPRRHRDPRPARHEPAVPASRRVRRRATCPTARPRRAGDGRRPRRRRSDERPPSRSSCSLALAAYAVFGGADFGAGFWDLTAGGPERGARPRALIEHSIGPVWEANHVWLIFIFVVTWTAFPEAYASITLTLFVPLTIAALGIVLRGASFAFRKAVVTLRDRRDLRRRLRRLVGARAVLHGRRRRRRSPRAGSRPAARPATRSTAGSTRRRSSPASSPCRRSPTWPPSTWSGTARRGRRPSLVEYFRRRAVVAAVVAGVVGARRDGRAARRRAVRLRRHDVAGAPARHPRRRCAARRPRAAGPRRLARCPGARGRSPWPASSSPGAWPSGRTCCPRA